MPPEKDYTSSYKHLHQCPECGQKYENFLTYFVCPRCFQSDRIRYICNTYRIEETWQSILVNEEDFYDTRTSVRMIKTTVFVHIKNQF